MTDTHGGLSNDLADWYPLVQALDVPTPRTLIEPVPESLTALLDLVDPASPDFPADARETLERIRVALIVTGTPVFLRTGEMSAKHAWGASCLLDEPDNLVENLFGLYETQAMAWGVPMPEHIIIRELLPTEHLFYAFNGMPITKERRYFVRDGRVYDHHPYWPVSAIEDHHPHAADGRELPAAEWTETLREASSETAEEIEELTRLAERVGSVLPGAWSVDFLWVPDRGWAFIDAAHAERSYVMPEVDRAALR